MNILNGKPVLVYLDQNKWIDLSRAYYKRVEGEKFAQTLVNVQKAVAENIVIFPLSLAHIIETQKTPDIDRRKRLAKVMVEISKGWTIANHCYIIPKEISSAISKMFGKEAPMPNELQVIGRGIPFACGIAEDSHKNFGISEEKAKDFLNLPDNPWVLFQFLVGNDESIVKKGIKRYNRTAAAYAQETEKIRKIGKKYSRAIRKRTCIAEILIRDQSDFIDVFALHDLRFKDFLSMELEQKISFVEQIPTYDVEIELTTERNGHWNRTIDPNDMTDIGFLNVAIPYCDIVITEKIWTNMATRKKLSDKYKTTILKDISDLENIIS